MVILIGGVSCTGKTIMAQKLLEKYCIPYLSIDHIKMGLIRGNRYCDFTATDSDEVIEEKLWPVVKGIIETNIENGQHIIMEGCYIPPEHLDDFEPDYKKHIIAFYIGFSKDYLEQHYHSGILGHLCEIELKECDSGYMSRDHFADLHSRLKDRCLKAGARYFEIKGLYEEEMKFVYQWVDGQVHLVRRA